MAKAKNIGEAQTVILTTTVETEMTHTRIDSDVLQFIRNQANSERRTQSGMINKMLFDQMNIMKKKGCCK